MLDTAILAIATVIAASGVGWLIADEVRRARAHRRLSANLAWTVLWAAGLAVLFAAAWSSRGRS
jgi:hypothetical protein